MRPLIEFLRAESLSPLDANRVRRALRVELLRLSKSAVPHSYDTNELIDFARKAPRRRSDGPFLCALGAALQLEGLGSEASDAFDRAIARAGEGDLLAWTLLARATYQHFHSRDFRAVVHDTDTALRHAQPGSLTRSRCLILQGEAYRGLAEYERAESAFDAAIAVGVRETEPKALLALSEAVWMSGDLTRGRELNRRARRLYAEQGSHRGVAFADGDLAQAYIDEDPRAALALLDDAERGLLLLLDALRLGRLQSARGVALKRLGRYPEAQAAFLEAIRYFKDAGAVANVPMTRRNLARALQEAGHPDQAVGLLVSAAHETREGEALRCLVVALDFISNGLGSLPEAAAILAHARALFSKHADALTRDDLVTYAEALGRLGERGIVAHQAQVDLLTAVPARLREAIAVFDVGSHDYASTIRSRLGAGIRRQHAPEPNAIVSFLLSCMGNWFRNSDYQAEFNIAQDHAKFHLRHLKSQNLIAQHGTRKGAKYRLDLGLAK